MGRKRDGVLAMDDNMCNEKASLCRCYLPEGHEYSHTCKCGGKWVGSWDDDTFKVINWPNPKKQGDINEHR